MHSIEANINYAVYRNVRLYTMAAENMRIGTGRKSSISQPAWWNLSCTKAKRMKYYLLRRFRWTNNNADFLNYKAFRSLFKNICNAKSLTYKRNKRFALLRSRDNPKTFWRLVKVQNLKM